MVHLSNLTRVEHCTQNTIGKCFVIVVLEILWREMNGVCEKCGFPGGSPLTPGFGGRRPQEKKIDEE